jgi:hypothetical protein
MQEEGEVGGGGGRRGDRQSPRSRLRLGGGGRRERSRLVKERYAGQGSLSGLLNQPDALPAGGITSLCTQNRGASPSLFSCECVRVEQCGRVPQALAPHDTCITPGEAGTNGSQLVRQAKNVYLLNETGMACVLLAGIDCSSCCAAPPYVSTSSLEDTLIFLFLPP